MKILHAILSDDFYGSERYCIELATAQARAGHVVHILIRGRNTRCAHAFLRAIEATKVGMAAKSLSGAIQLEAIPDWLPAFLHRPLAWYFIACFRPDIVHSHLAPAARRIGAVAHRSGVSHVATLHLDFDEREHGQADGLIALSTNQRACIPRRFTSPVATVWNWLSPSIAEALTNPGAPARDALRRAWRADDRTMVFGSVGRLQPQKGMDVLIAAFRRAFPPGTDTARLVIVGDGPQRQQLEDARAGDRRIVLAGVQDNVAGYYRAFDVFVSAARFEPFGFAIVEAMAAGCPLVLARTLGPSEFVTDARALWAVPGDETSLAEQLLTAMSRRDGRLTYVMTPFSLERASEQIDQFYRRLTRRSLLT
jgi:glycosyltransferase involved in cell wall biosynthesis